MVVGLSWWLYRDTPEGNGANHLTFSSMKVQVERGNCSVDDVKWDVFMAIMVSGADVLETSPTLQSVDSSMTALFSLIIISCCSSSADEDHSRSFDAAPSTVGETTPTQADPAPTKESSTSRVVRIKAERDIVLLGARLARETGEIPSSDSRDLEDALAEVYERMLKTGDALPLPLGETAWGSSAPADFDALIVGPIDAESAIVFLHGYGGLFNVQCWQMSQSAPPSTITICPDGGAEGRWWTLAGRRTLDKALDLVEAEGVRDVVLAGLSNGARGAATLAPGFAHRLSGVIVISGASRTRPPPGLPILAIQGTQDTMFAPGSTRGYARRAGENGTYIAIESGHFVFLDRAEEVREAIAGWLLTARPS